LAEPATTERTRELRLRFVEACGFWNESFAELLRTDEEFFCAYLALVETTASRGALSPRLRELVHVAVDAAATHMYAPGVREHIAGALREGASASEVMEVLELTATLGIHACTLGVPILLDELEAAGLSVDATSAARAAALRDEFVAARGYWNEFWDGLVALDPEFFSAYTTFSGVPWTHGPLGAKEKELIYTAFDVAATHLFAPGLRQHIRNALSYGASAAEVLEVFEIATTLGIHACNLGVPILVEELATAEGRGGVAEEVP